LGYKHGMEGRVMGGKERTKCEFDRNGLCRARACYSHQKCGARDKYGNPKYKEVKE